MKTHGTNGTLGIISPFAFASAGEQSFNWAYEQLTKFRPGGKKYNRLRALLTAGEALKETPDLYAAAPELLEALANLHKKARWINDWQHNGNTIEPADWNELNDLLAESRSVIDKTQKPA